ncbi:MAG: hypothetical protein U1E48_13905 [Paracoccaceae bacterium]
MRGLLSAMFLVLALPAAAEDGWTMLKGDEVKAALAGHTLAYANGATQVFKPSGDTSYDSGHLQPGSWRIEGDRYCSVWPPSSQWTCYGLERSADGKGVRFIADDGSMTEGRYADPG